MNDLELGHRLRTALDEYTAAVPLPHINGPVFRPWTSNTSRSIDGSGCVRVGHRHRARPRRAVLVIAITIGLVGTGTGLAAATGAFDQPAHRAAVHSFDQSVTLMMESIRQGFNEQFAAEFRSVHKTFKPKDIVLEASTRGPQHSTFTVWTYFHQSRPPWCQGMVVTVRKRAMTLGGGCQISGSSPVPGNSGQESEWPCAPPSTPEYFAIMGEVPTDVARVLLQIPGLAPLNAPVTDGWFVTVAAQKVNGPVPETYLDASGAPIGSGTWNGGETTC